MKDSTFRLCLWAGPRNVSTALLYAFAQRGDTRVVDEPLYGHYLRVTGAPHPGADEVVAAMDTDGERVVREVILGPCDRPVLFLKQMAHHLVELDRGFLSQVTNLFLVRDPVEMLPSLIHQVPEPQLEDTGLAVQSRLLAELRAAGEEPAVIDAKELLLDPPGVLRRLCAHLGLDFDPAMLSWSATPRPEDGVWAPYWYDNLHRSTGFLPYRPKSEPFPERLRPLLAECAPHYETLAAAAIRAGA
jgi:hypothetical protein